jgi:hypothetical protein
VPKYRVYFTTTASSVVEIEAEDRDAAVDAAYDELPSSLCSSCSGWGQRVGIDLGGEWQADEEFIEEITPETQEPA